MQILQTLKLGTREAHTRIERVVPLGRRSLTVAVYRAYLARLLGFYLPLEDALGMQDWTSVGLDFEPRRKAPLLVADVVSLGLEAGALASLPRCTAILRVSTLPEALGCAYVLEGATLGGHLLARQVGQALGLSREHGCSFLLAYGDGYDAMWRTFGEAVEAAVHDEATGARVLDAARETFALLHRWIEEGHGTDERA